MLLCVKAHHVEDLLPILPNGGADGVVVYLGNGLGVVERLARALPGRLLAASSTHGAMRGEGSTSAWTGRGEVVLGPWPDGAPSDAVEALATCLTAAGLSARCVEDARRQIWSKALLNIAINPLCALAGVRNGEMLHTPLFDAAVGLLMEAEQVGRVNLPSMDELVTTLVDVLDATAENRWHAGRRQGRTANGNRCAKRIHRQLGRTAGPHGHTKRAGYGVDSRVAAMRSALKCRPRFSCCAEASFTTRAATWTMFRNSTNSLVDGIFARSHHFLCQAEPTARSREPCVLRMMPTSRPMVSRRLFKSCASAPCSSTGSKPSARHDGRS